MRSLSVVAVDKKWKNFFIRQIDLEGNREVTITEMKEDSLSLNVKSSNKDKLLDIPALDGWKIH